MREKRNRKPRHSLKRLLLLNLIFLFASISFSQAIPVGSGVRLYTGSGYFTFSNLLTANSTVYMNNGWNLTSVQLTGDDEALSYAWIRISTGRMTITHLIYKKQFTATVTAPSGTVLTVQLKLSKWASETPKSIKINNVYYKSMAHSMQEFNNAQYTTWYWKSGILYLKIKTSSSVPIIIDWASAPPEKPPAAPSPPSPPAQPTIPSPKGAVEAFISMVMQFVNQAYMILSTLSLTTWVILLITIIAIIIIIRSRGD